YSESFKESSRKIYKTSNNCRLKRKEQKIYSKRNPEEKLKKIENLPRNNTVQGAKEHKNKKNLDILL
ncbi:13696_t:CDS:1, partial [Dentiscutata heterogama]